ncbi:ATP-binding protein [Vibrio sp. WJH972]
MKPQQSLKRKSFIALVAYLVLFIAISGALIHWVVKAPISSQLKENLDLRAEIFAGHVKEPLLESLSILDSVVSVGQANIDRDSQTELLKELFQHINSIVVSGGLWPQPFLDGEDMVYSSLFFNQGSDGAVDQVTSWDNAISGGYDQEEWYKSVANQPPKTVHWSQVYVDGYTRVKMITISQPYYIDNEFSGVATVDLSLDDLVELISPTASQSQIGVNLIDSYGSPVASHQFRVKQSGYISQYHFADLNWILEVVNSNKSVNEQITEIVTDIELWLIPFLLVGLIFGYLMLNRKIISPIVDIADRLKNSKEGGMIDMPYRSHDEIRYLIDALNQKTVFLDAEKMKAQESTTAKSNFFATLSHEIRTPMNGVLGNAQLMMNDELSPAQAKRLQVLHQSGEHMMTLLDEILDYSKIEQGYLELDAQDFALEDLTDSIVSVYQGLCDEKGLTLNIESNIEPDRYYVGDISRIKQILFNLLNNAVKFTDQGHISIRLDEEVTGYQENTLSISIEDSGIGISPEAQDKIFRPFEQAELNTNRRYGGTGLGLAIVDQLIKLMGGEIKLTSILSLGSFFDVKLPLKLGTKTESSTSYVTKDVQFNGIKALIVEDNRVNAHILESFLVKREIESVVAEDGSIALDQLEKEDFDFILMDHHMPVMDGIETIKRIRARGDAINQIFILGCSADVFKQAKDKMMNAGADVMLNKPVMEQELNDVLYRHTDKIYQYHKEAAQPSENDPLADDKETED